LWFPDTVGVGQNFTAPASSNSPLQSPLRLVCPPVAQATVGVGHMRWRDTHPFSVVLLSQQCFLSPPLLLVGVGTNPYPVPLVRCSGMVRSDNSPPRIVPQRGKVTEHDIESSGNKQG
jgi:hypothetical protein